MKHLINSQLICANYEKNYPMVEYGKGVYLYDKTGKEYMDVSGCTAAVTHIGHGVEEVANVLSEQANKLAVHPTHVFYNEELEEYLQMICDFAPEGFNHAWTISGGTEAVENAIKLAYQYQKTKGHKRKRVLARWGSYHGNSLTVLDVGGLVARRNYYTDLMVDHCHVSPCYTYRKQDGLTDQAYEDMLINEFTKTLEENPDIFCFVAEPFVGAALGAAGPTKNYFKRIKDICVQKDIILIADEVMTGFGRTGENFGMDHFGNYADILCCAKGISSGYFPLGAIIAHDHIYDTLKNSGKPFFSGQTYSCIPLAAAVGKANLKYIQDHHLVDNAKQVGNYLKEKMQEIELDCIGDVRGEGLFLGMEFVSNQETKTIFKPEFMFAKKVEAKAFEHGLVTYGCRGTVNGFTEGDHMLFAPPLTLTTEHADILVDRLSHAIKEVHEEYHA